MPDPYRKARPKELKTPLLNNPGKGCATFQRFNGDPLNPPCKWSEEGPLEFPPAEKSVADHYLPSTVSYCRWFWEVFEPEEGKYDWSVIEAALKTARERGQTLQVRLMAFGSHNQPQLPQWYRDKYPVRLDEKTKRASFISPQYDGPEYLEIWTRAIREFGRLFDGHPDLESVDLSFAGPWGEGAGEVPEKKAHRFIDTYLQALPQTNLLVNSGCPSAEYAIAHGTGWRVDCYGDFGMKDDPDPMRWCHMYDSYPCRIAAIGATEAWETAPVTLESCGTPNSWHRKNFDLDLIIQQGLKYHASVFMPKSDPLPDEYVEPLADFCDRMGYRLVLRQAVWRGIVERGGRMSVNIWIENTGVAPVYHDYVPVLRLQGGDGEVFIELPSNPREWLPGDAIIEEELPVPEEIRPGEALLSMGLVRPPTKKPVVRFAVQETDEQGWVPLGPVTVK